MVAVRDTSGPSALPAGESNKHDYDQSASIVFRARFLLGRGAESILSLSCPPKQGNRQLENLDRPNQLASGYCSYVTVGSEAT
jgi:hypothetical protein